MTEDQLVGTLRANARASNDATGLQPPATELEINGAEQSLGFQLPPILKRIYREVGNGGRRLGPAYGIHGVGASGYETPDNNLLQVTSRIAREHGWWEEFIVIAEIGCAAFYCVDCGDSDFPVYHLNGNEIASLMYDEDYDPDEIPDVGWDAEYDTLEEWLILPNFSDN